jgi:hypothetical protein
MRFFFPCYACCFALSSPRISSCLAFSTSAFSASSSLRWASSARLALTASRRALLMSRFSNSSLVSLRGTGSFFFFLSSLVSSSESESYFFYAFLPIGLRLGIISSSLLESWLTGTYLLFGLPNMASSSASSESCSSSSSSACFLSPFFSSSSSEESSYSAILALTWSISQTSQPRRAASSWRRAS